jgi:hypothetical protein
MEGADPHAHRVDRPHFPTITTIKSNIHRKSNESSPYAFIIGKQAVARRFQA